MKSIRYGGATWICCKSENVYKRDGSQPFPKPFQKLFSGVITNPPFGSLGETISVDGFAVRTLDHLMSIYGLKTMADNGRAAIIIGGHTEWDSLNRIKKGKNRLFFNYLYKFYNVLDVVPINGKKLYSRMGTGFDVRLILISGRKSIPGGAAPLKSDSDKVVNSFQELFDRSMKALKQAENMDRKSNKRRQDLEAEAAAMMASMDLYSNDGLEGPYRPGADACFVLDTVVPDYMDTEIHEALLNCSTDS